MEDRGLNHVGKLLLSGKVNLPFVQTGLKKRNHLDGVAEGSASSGTDMGVGEHDDLFDGKSRMLYVSSGRERWRKAEAEKHRSISRTTKETRSAVLVEKPKKEQTNTPRPASKLRDQITIDKSSREDDREPPRKDKRTKKEEQLVDAYTMLVCDLMYVAKTQGVDLDGGLGEVGLPVLKWLGSLTKASQLGE
jgi:hypothetical protein